MIDLRHIDAMQQHVRDAEHVRELLFLDAVDGAADRFLIRGRLHLLLELLQPAHEEATGAAREVYQDAIFDTMAICAKVPKML